VSGRHDDPLKNVTYCAAVALYAQDTPAALRNARAVPDFRKVR
jgi:hypothetical protein